jgi:DNA-directed RNA polymerase specialized sigma24 family protein
MLVLERRGLRHVDIAAQAGVSVRHVRSLLSRMRKRPNGRPRGT